MVIKNFPNPRKSTPEGIIGIGGDLEPESLILAYSQGIFPWPLSEGQLLWFCPPERAILETQNLHVSRSLARAKKKSLFRFTFDTAFAEVISACAKVPRPMQDGTWITSRMVEAYNQLYHLGYAHSIEVWNRDQLVGGMYGVAVHGVFAGESMFYEEPNASKLAILYLMDHLQSRGLDWIDIQVLTPHMVALGARTLSRDDYLEKLASTRSLGIKLF